jgi:hypothetical protein
MMQFEVGPYVIKTHELDSKLSVQVVSELGEVRMRTENNRAHDFPNAICFYVDGLQDKPEAKGLKKFIFGDYTFVLGINYTGELFLFHSILLTVGKKVIDGKDSLTLAFLKDPKA